MGLEVETVEAGERRKPVADYIKNHDGAGDVDANGDDISDIDWDEWLQTHRVELNAMTTPQLIEWLDRKMETFGAGKLIPPDDGAGGGSQGAGRKESPRRNHRAHPARSRAGRPGRRGRWRRSTCRTARRWPAESSNCSRTSRTPNGATMSRRSPRTKRDSFKIRELGLFPDPDGHDSARRGSGCTGAILRSPGPL